VSWAGSLAVPTSGQTGPKRPLRGYEKADASHFDWLASALFSEKVRNVLRGTAGSVPRTTGPGH
jgi:hypothetical protein